MIKQFRHDVIKNVKCSVQSSNDLKISPKHHLTNLLMNRVLDIVAGYVSRVLFSLVSFTQYWYAGAQALAATLMLYWIYNPSCTNDIQPVGR